MNGWQTADIVVSGVISFAAQNNSFENSDIGVFVPDYELQV